MANGQQKGAANFEAWSSLRRHRPHLNDWRDLANGSNLNRVKLAMELGCGKSALAQNPKLAQGITEVELWLRDGGVLKQTKNKIKAYLDMSGSQAPVYPEPAERGLAHHKISLNSKYNCEFCFKAESENEILRTEKDILEKELQVAKEIISRYKLLDEILEDSLRIPR
jgi:hypothetical protein